MEDFQQSLQLRKRPVLRILFGTHSFLKDASCDGDCVLTCNEEVF